MTFEFEHIGNIHELVMSMFGGSTYTLQSKSGSTLRVSPDFGSDTVIGAVRANLNSEVLLTFPVKLVDLNGKAKMTIQIQVKDVRLAPPRPEIREVQRVPAHRSDTGEQMPEVEGRRGFEGLDEVRCAQFAIGGYAPHSQKIKFE